MLSKLKRLVSAILYCELIPGSSRLILLILIGSIMSMVQTDFASTSIVDKTVDFKKGGVKIHIDGPIVDSSSQSSMEIFEEIFYGSRKHKLSKLKNAFKRAAGGRTYKGCVG